MKLTTKTIIDIKIDKEEENALYIVQDMLENIQDQIDDENLVNNFVNINRNDGCKWEDFSLNNFLNEVMCFVTACVNAKILQQSIMININRMMNNHSSYIVVYGRLLISIDKIIKK